MGTFISSLIAEIAVIVCAQLHKSRPPQNAGTDPERKEGGDAAVAPNPSVAVKGGADSPPPLSRPENNLMAGNPLSVQHSRRLG